VRRYLRRSLACVLMLAGVLSIGVPTASSGVGLQTVRLSCNDGTNLGLALDPTAVAALTGAVAAVNLFPAGLPPLTCATQSTAAGSSNGRTDFVVGGGHATGLGVFTGSPDCQYNFSVSGHVPTGTPSIEGEPQAGAGGTFNLKATNTKCGFTGQVVAKVDCVNVFGPGMAQITANVTHTDAGVFFPLAGSDIEVDFYDSGMPGGAGDKLDIFTQGPPAPCSFEGPYLPNQSVDQGNININRG
jgi:hypothetical protein